MSKAPNGVGGALTPVAAQGYARQRGIGNQQAHQELQQQVSQLDEEQAVENMDEVGVKRR